MKFHRWFDSLREPWRFALFFGALLATLFGTIAVGTPWPGLLIMIGAFYWRLAYLRRSNP